MKVLAINGSPRKAGNTTNLIKSVFKELEAEGIETEMISLAGKKLAGCMACMQCMKNKDMKCVIDDDLNPIIPKLKEADGIILGSPVYYANVSGQMKCFIDRAGFVSGANDNFLRRKVGAPVVAVRRAGATNTFDAMNKFFFIKEMVVPGSTYWNLGIGLHPGDVESDEEGQTTMTNLGKNMAWLMKKLND